MSIQNRYFIETTRINSIYVSTVYQDGKYLKSMIPTKFLHPIKHQTKWNTIYYPAHNLVIVGPYGLSGGGNCTSQPGRSNSTDHIKITEKFRLNESTKDLSLNLNTKKSTLACLKDERKESMLKKLIYQILNSIKSGKDFSYIVKQIEEQEFSVGVGYYHLCVQILTLLGNEKVHEKTEWVYCREKLLSIAKRLLVFHIAFTDQITDPGAYDAAKAALDQIWKVCDYERPIPDIGFFVILKTVEMLVEGIEKTAGKANPLAEYLQKVISDKQNCKESSKAVNLYLKSAAKAARNLICDMILLEFLGKHENKQEVVRNIMDMHCNLSWENTAIILEYVIPCFKPIDTIQFLSEYLYFSSFEKDVWKVQSRVIQLLVQVKGLYKEEFSNLIEIVLNEKKNVENIESVKLQLQYLDLYENSVCEYFKFNKPQIGAEHFWMAPDRQVVLKREENEEIWMLMANFESKVLLINGPYGAGKTDLALSYAFYTRNKYKLIVFINCSTIAWLNRSVMKIAKKAKLIQHENFEDTLNAVIRYFSNKTEKFLLIFDDVNDIKLIKNLMPSTGHIILTSRDPIWDFRYELSCKTEKIIQGADKNLNRNLVKYCVNWRNLKVLTESDRYSNIFTDEYSQGASFFEIIFLGILNKVECEIFILSLSRIRNFPIKKQQLLSIFYGCSDEKNFAKLDLILLYLIKLNLVIEKKSCKYVLERDFYLFLRKKGENFKSQVLSCLNKAFDVDWSYENLKSPNSRLNLSKLVSKFSLNLQFPCESTGKMSIHKGFYHLFHTKNYKSALKWLEISLSNLPKASQTWKICSFLIGKSYLYLNRLDDSISTFTELLEQPLDLIFNHLIKAYLIKSYEILGKGIKIRDIIFDQSTILSKIEIPEACYFTIHGICRLFLTEKSLKSLIAPFSSLLTGHTSSALLIKTLLKLSLFFSYKERWTTVLGYINLIGPILPIPHILQPSNLSLTLDTLIQLLNQIKSKISELAGENHQVLYTIHLILAKIFATLQDNENRRINLESALEISKISKVNDLDIAQAQYELAKFYGIKMKNFEYAKNFLDQAELTIKFYAGEESILHARVVEMRGLFLVSMGYLVQAGEFINKSFAIKQKILENSPDNEEMSQIYASLGKLAKKSRNLTQALHYYAKALEPNHKMYYSSIWSVKAYKIALELKQYKEALDFKSQQIRMLIHLYDSNLELVFNEYQKAYSLAIEIKSYEQANNFALASLDILRRIDKTSQINYTESMYLIKVADSFLHLRKYDEAEEYLIEAVEISKQKYPDEEYANAKCALGVFYKNIGKYAKAIVEMSEVLEKLDKTKRARIFTDIGLCYMKKKCLDEAASAFNNSTKLYKDQGLKLEVGKTHILMSYLYKDDYFLTSKYLKKAISIYNEVLGEEHKETVSLITRLSSLKKMNESSYI